MEGYNGRLDAIQAGILRVRLHHVTGWNKHRRQRAECYNELLAPMAGRVTVPYQPSKSKPVYHLYVIRTPYRDEVPKHLTEAGIGTGIHYPFPVHFQAAYASLGWKRGDFSASEEATDQILSLPMFAGLRSGDQHRVVEAVAGFASIRSASEARFFPTHSHGLFGAKGKSSPW